MYLSVQFVRLFPLVGQGGQVGAELIEADGHLKLDRRLNNNNKAGPS